MATTAAQVSADSYKYQWARHVARMKLDADFKILSAKLTEANLAPAAETVSKLALSVVDNKDIKAKTIGLTPEVPGVLKLGIVGAGCAGLFTGLVLDWLNEANLGLDISYDILEAAGQDRLGGRLFTHKFSEEKHDYYDVGAMRFPDNKIMARTFQLFDYIGIEKGKNLIEYYFEGKNCPTYYNDIRYEGAPPKVEDPYKVNEGLRKHERIPPELLRETPEHIIKTALREFTEIVKTKFEEKRAGESQEELWRLLMKADFMSTRQFLSSTTNPGLPSGPGYNFNTIEWLETFTLATGWFNQSLTETVMEILDFDVDEAAGKKYWCIEGGTQQVASLMAAKLKKQPEFHQQVVAIDANVGNSPKSNSITLTIQQEDGQRGSRDYLAVFNSTTLGALQRMDLTKAGLSYSTKQAVRSLGYGASCKVGMKFRTPWWRTKFDISEGGMAKTDLPLRVCVYPSYNTTDPIDEPAVLLCSYTWAQDAQRLGALISEDTPERESELKRVLFHNLALLHANEKIPYQDMLKILEDEYITHHAYDWYADNYTAGAFAYFGPGQFSNMWPAIVRPNDGMGRMFFIGEAASAHHAWIVGALESVVWGVYQMLESCHLANKTYAPYKKAMELLRGEGAQDNLPFHPLPKEMPKTQLDTPGRKDLVDELDGKNRLTYTAALVALGFLESLVELVEAGK